MSVKQSSRHRFGEGALALLISLLVLGVPAGSGANAASPDFALTVTPSAATISAGSAQRFTVTVTSENGLRGTVNVLISSVVPQLSNGPTFHLTRYDIPVSPTSPTGTAYLTAFTTSGTPKTTYTITVRGKDITGGPGYGVIHTASFTLTVQ